MITVTKTVDERFLFADGAYQDTPNTTTLPCIVISKTVADVSKVVASGLAAAPLAQVQLDERVAEQSTLLDMSLKAKRLVALGSPVLTIFTDSTLTDAEKNNINRVRQEWRDMTSQPGYPEIFIEPAL